MSILTIHSEVNRGAAGAILALQPSVEVVAIEGHTYYRYDLEREGLVRPETAVQDLVDAFAVRHTIYGNEAEMELLRKHVEQMPLADFPPSVVIERYGQTLIGKMLYSTLRFRTALALWHFAESWARAKEHEAERLKTAAWWAKVNQEQRQRDEEYFQETLRLQPAEPVLILLHETEQGWSRENPGVFEIWAHDIDELRNSENPLVLRDLGVCEDEQWEQMDLSTGGQLGRLIVHIIDTEGDKGPHVHSRDFPEEVIDEESGKKEVVFKKLLIVDCRRYLKQEFLKQFIHVEESTAEEGQNNA